jgi:acetolactate synthase-1/2/3 large subunit
MPKKLRGADILLQTLECYGASKLFTLSGNHVMPLFDAVQDTGIGLIHVRHEAAAVHMAEAWARVTGKVGFALATGGQGHANGAAGLFNARSSDSPIVYLSGHAGLKELGRGAFQEMAQAEMARPVTKASWTAQSAATLGHELARAIQVAASGRPGPVHLSLPVDLLEQELSLEAPASPDATAMQPLRTPLADDIADLMLAKLLRAHKPLVLCGPALCTPAGREEMRKLEAALAVPVIGIESPRGINDPSLGAFVEVLGQADLVLLIAKALDFSLKFGEASSESCEFMVLHPEIEATAHIARSTRGRLASFGITDPASAMQALIARSPKRPQTPGWREEVASAIGYRPPQWQQARSKTDGALHPVEVCREINAFLGQHPNHIVVCDGGEFGQWAQSLVKANKRLINGLAGSIGIGMPFAMAAKAAHPDNTVLVIMGDGTFGFHMAEFETALRHGLPVIAIVGNDAYWNAEYQIQLRSYGRERAKGCELLPAHYEKVVEALGGHGEHVTSAGQLPAALARAQASGKPACINVRIESVAAPIVRRAQ